MHEPSFPLREMTNMPTASKSITVHGNGMLPLYRHGDQLIVAEGLPLKVGDRVVIDAADLPPIAGTLIHKDEKQVILKAGGTSRKSIIFNTPEIKAMRRIIWASQ